MGKKKPCKPKPKEEWGGFFFAPLWPHSETYMPSTMNEAYNKRLYALTLGNPKKAHVLCPIHVK